MMKYSLIIRIRCWRAVSPSRLPYFKFVTLTGKTLSKWEDSYSFALLTAGVLGTSMTGSSVDEKRRITSPHSLQKISTQELFSSATSHPVHPFFSRACGMGAEETGSDGSSFAKIVGCGLGRV